MMRIGVVQYFARSCWARFLLANINNTLLPTLLKMMAVVGNHLVDDDVPHAVLGMSTDDSLGAVASIQEVDTSKSLPPLNWV